MPWCDRRHRSHRCLTHVVGNSEHEASASGVAAALTPRCHSLVGNSQDDPRRVHLRVMNGVARGRRLRLVVVGTSSVEVAGEARKVARLHVQPNAVSLLEHVAGHHTGQLHLVDLTHLHEDFLVVALSIAGSLDRFIQVVGPAVGKDVDQLCSEVRIPGVGRDVEDNLDRTRDVQVLRERFARVNQYVCSSFDRTLVESTS